MIDFTLTESQELLRSSARTLFGRECPPALVRAVADDPSAFDPLGKHLREWAGLADGPLVDLCLFCEEAGAVVAPGPFWSNAALFVPLLRACGHPLADAAAAGEVTGTAAWAGSDGEWSPSGAGDDSIRTFVLEADRVDHVALVVPGPAVVVVPAGGLAPRPVGWLDLSRRIFEVPVPDLGSAGDCRVVTAEALAGALARATVALAAEMVGTARWLLEASVSYAGERVQFGRPIGSFQAVAHKLADMALAHERATAAVYHAAMAVDAGDSGASRAVHVAKAAAGEAATRCAKDAIQVHGGIGYTWEHDLHLYIRRAYACEHLLGTTAWHHDRLADLLFG